MLNLIFIQFLLLFWNSSADFPLPGPIQYSKNNQHKHGTCECNNNNKTSPITMTIIGRTTTGLTRETTAITLLVLNINVSIIASTLLISILEWLWAYALLLAILYKMLITFAIPLNLTGIPTTHTIQIDTPISGWARGGVDDIQIGSVGGYYETVVGRER